eukprot:CAMPEP_0181249216 /NCGR_PEP_ID=MMETSP1096-20121128/45629_1 /TAXON_ID=156174 ORGANISM="Chrysochromulina ericina, Strain CCMP281" /NCGR_SAMPLE_ID=MMETSP1096 /ASSEMBLY_ACC=CAM_ASM_000453 /LENGTH=68 /DNA_ID=CAMNT_0023346525 /DNA_START=478 /DNA_END=684 /DNA_ORIENTATION=+
MRSMWCAPLGMRTASTESLWLVRTPHADAVRLPPSATLAHSGRGATPHWSMQLAMLAGRSQWEQFCLA